MKYISLALGIVLLATACEKDITVKVPPQSTKLVLNGIINMGNPFRVSVGKTAGILDLTTPDSYKVTNALVQLYENGVLKDTLVYNANNDAYRVKNNTLAQTGNTYRIQASVPGFTTVEALTVAPATIAIQSITRRQNAKTDANGNVLDEVKITFKDDATAKNFYLFKFRQANGFNGNTVIYTNMYYCLHSSDKDIDRRNNSDPTDFESCLDDEFFMQDKNFNGSTKEVLVFVEHQALEPYKHPTNNRVYRPIVELNSITADHYKYRKSYNAYQDSEDNPFAEPVLVFGNVKNGYGVFSTYSVVRDTIR
jgi:hypothetical protein